MSSIRSISPYLRLSRSLDPQRGIERYLSPGEHVICASRRHVVVLDPAIGIWITAAVLGSVAVLGSRQVEGASLWNSSSGELYRAMPWGLPAPPSLLFRQA